jgi:radical SAM superfamily enzyme YgiQ (UPF0313 family)
MTDCLLVFPKPSIESPDCSPALSVFFPGAAVQEAGGKVRYLDLRFDAEETLIAELRRKPMIVGVSSMTGFQLAEAARVLTLTRQLSPSSVTVLGGCHASSLPEECASDPKIDVVIVGDGERPLVRLVEAGGQPMGISGTCYRREERLVREPIESHPVLDVPFPLRPETERYFRIAAESRYLRYPDSRGCPFSCRFCFNNSVPGAAYRCMPFEMWTDHVLRLRSALPLDRLVLSAEIFGANRQRLLDVVTFLNGISLPYFASMRCDQIDTEAAALLARTGCEELYLGAESGSDRVLQDIVGKRMAGGVEAILGSARALAPYAIRCTYSFIVGFPGERSEDRRASMAIAEDIARVNRKALVTFFVFTPYPGTPLFEEMVQGGYQPPVGLEAWSRMSRSDHEDSEIDALYYLAGLRFQGRKGGKTSQNFRGVWRLAVLPLEAMARLRWRYQLTWGFGLEKRIARHLFQFAAHRKAVRLSHGRGEIR